MAKLTQEGGAKFMNYLISCTVPATDAQGKFQNNKKPVREWQFQDILRMPDKLQKEWKTACIEELEALR